MANPKVPPASKHDFSNKIKKNCEISCVPTTDKDLLTYLNCTSIRDRSPPSDETWKSYRILCMYMFALPPYGPNLKASIDKSDVVGIRASHRRDGSESSFSLDSFKHDDNNPWHISPLTRRTYIKRAGCKGHDSDTRFQATELFDYRSPLLTPDREITVQAERKEEKQPWQKQKRPTFWNGACSNTYSLELCVFIGPTNIFIASQGNFINTNSNRTTPKYDATLAVIDSDKARSDRNDAICQKRGRVKVPDQSHHCGTFAVSRGEAINNKTSLFFFHWYVPTLSIEEWQNGEIGRIG